ncbi:kinase-like domain-containing protein [Multifurca ochricompacta]|uniref:non-specific serine/threonine protein kinase n=1 Tax=Multifurca ochricompacta TaxID=376703 RepID=A0AAD4M913_9AGAM|nr:kinase-like domain-containing protein [Multifurca ochricompacta]
MTALITTQDRLEREIDSLWHPILHASNQVVLYNPTSHALTIHSSQSTTVRQSVPHLCPYCSQPFPKVRTERESTPHDQDSPLANLNRFEDVSGARASNYFHLLQVANESASRPPSPPLHSPQSVPSSRTNTRPSSPTPVDDCNVFPPEAMAEGYFKAFFQEEARLGMGANGSVFLCQHVLNGNPLGRFAVKKIAVGQSASYLLKILREVHLLETLRHPNIITYHHAWLETAQFSSFGPKIPTLHVLMQWAEGGSLDDYIDARLGRSTHLPHPTSPHASTHDDESSPDLHSRSARIRAFRAMQRAPSSEKPALRAKLGNNDHTWKAVHLLSAEEALGIFGGVAAGLGFLHDKSILHLDLKPGNVLLTWDDSTLLPRAMLSDFGTSRDMLQTPRARSGNTGTLEYTSPESLPTPPHNTLPPTDSNRISYGDRPGLDGSSNTSHNEDNGKGSDMDRLEREVSSYPGFKSTARLETLFASRRLPRSYLVLLESLLNFNPIPPKSSMSDAFAPMTTSPTPSSPPPSSPTLPQLTSSPTPSSLPAPLPGKSGEKKRPRSPVRPYWQKLSELQQHTAAQVLRAFKSGVLALKVASLCLSSEALPLWVLSLLAGLSIVDSLSDNITLNLSLGIVHVVVLKTWKWWEW